MRHRKKSFMEKNKLFIGSGGVILLVIFFVILFSGSDTPSGDSFELNGSELDSLV